MPQDVGRLKRLMTDPHPAVHVAAVASLERMENQSLTLTALDRLPRLAPTVQAYYAAMLLRSRPVVVDHLQRRLRRTEDPALPRFAEFAARLAEPALRERLTALADHADPEVRTQSARALGSYPHRESVAALKRLITDEAWTVRAQAARSLGMITDAGTLPSVTAALRDDVWWVRLRAALALMRFAAAGRNALLQAEVGGDAYARDMAKLVLGLPAQALAEFAA
jgi:HEAT repeat protein